MITVLAKLKAKAGSEEQLAEVASGLAREVREKEEGCLMYIAHTSVKNPGEVIFFEKYADPEAFTLHSKTPHFRAAGAKFKDLLDGPPEITMLKELE